MCSVTGHSQPVGHRLRTYQLLGSKIETHNLPVMKCDIIAWKRKKCNVTHTLLVMAHKIWKRRRFSDTHILLITGIRCDGTWDKISKKECSTTHILLVMTWKILGKKSPQLLPTYYWHKKNVITLHKQWEKIQNHLLPVVHQKRCFLVKKGMPCYSHTVGYEVWWNQAT